MSTKDELANYQKLANNFFVYLNQEMATQMTVVTTQFTPTAVSP